MAYGCLVWVGGPRAGVVVRVVAQPRCLAGYIPGIYLVYQYTWYIPGIYYPPKPLYPVYCQPYSKTNHATVQMQTLFVCLDYLETVMHCK